MSVLGQWYMIPGDIPADFVVPLVLHADGRAEWQGDDSCYELWRLEDGELVIGESAAGRTVFSAGTAEVTNGVLKGQIESRWEPEDENDIGGFSDAAVLLRDPGKIPIRRGE